MSEEHPATVTPRPSVSEIARRTFSTVRRGFDPEEVRSYLELVAGKLAAAEQREDELQRELVAAEDQALHPDIDEATLTTALGQRSAAVLRKAHEEAARITEQADAAAAALSRTAHKQATEAQVQAEAAAAERIAEAEIAANTLHQQAREEAASVLAAVRAESDQILERAREQGRVMLDQAQDARRRVLADMAQRRRAMTVQIDQFRAARDEVAAAVVGVRHSVDRIVDDLARADDEARAAAAQVAHGHPMETTESVLVVEAEQAAAELGARTGTPADVDATRPLLIDEIRTVVPPHGAEMPDESYGTDALGAGDEGGAGEDPGGRGPGGEPGAAEEIDEVAPVPRFLFDDVDGGSRGHPPGDVGPSPARKDPTAEPGPWSSPEPIEDHLGAESALGEVTFEGESFEAEVFEGNAFGKDQFGGDQGAEPGQPPSGPPEEDMVEGLFARLRASRASTEEHRDAPTHGSAPDELGSLPASESAGAEQRAREASEDTPPFGVAATTAVEELDDVSGTAEVGPEAVLAGPADEAADEDRSSEGTPALKRATARRTEMLDPIAAVLARRLKRALQDDQNRLLERLRNGPGEWSDTLLPEEGEQRELYIGAALPHVRDAVAAGMAYARSPGRRSRGKARVTDDATAEEIASELGGTVVTVLRRRLTGDDVAEPTERVGAAYREWRGERIERLVGDCALEAFSSGVLAALPAGNRIRWVRNEATLGCADCEDNALGDTVASGEEFPTGHLHPPAHPGCRCLLLPTPV